MYNVNNEYDEKELNRVFNKDYLINGFDLYDFIKDYTIFDKLDFIEFILWLEKQEANRVDSFIVKE